MAKTYEEIKKAVFYAHEKPDLLAEIIYELANPEEENNEEEPKD